MKDRTDDTGQASDEALIKGFLSGKAEDFNVLYGRYKRQLYSYLNRLVPGQHALADDLFQQTWLKALDQLPRYENRQKFLAWLMRIAHNLAMDHYRSLKSAGVQASSEEVDDKIFKGSDEPWREMDCGELGEALDFAMEQLPPELREVFLLRQDGIAFKEIAEIQNCSINTTLSRMQYALRKLRNNLAEWCGSKGVAK